MKKSWKKITISHLDKDPEVLLPTLYEFKTLGLEQKENSLEVYFSDKANSEQITKKIQKDLKKYKIQGRITVQVLKNEDWHLTWKKDFHPIKVSEKIRITPAWIQPDTRSHIEIKINPGMAFGTGTHATTQLALQLLERYLEPGQNILDAGCGSGILTVAALKLGAKSVESWDISDDVRENFAEHMQLNDCPEQYSLVIGDVTEKNDYPFDLVLSNIQKNVNLKLLQSLVNNEYQGTMIFTGLLKEDEQEFRTTLKTNNKNVLEKLEQKNWIALAAK
ncbi:MAG: 50S ribosomal protein L11 methyltransferase [Candidatus Marinimicrobia bacterium]|nr:50S ribosomal protein L11 methyltransferase [Candidatus Neomarinimicrobiota bacterium]